MSCKKPGGKKKQIYKQKPGKNWKETAYTLTASLLLIWISLRMCLITYMSNVRLTLYPNHKVGQVIIVLDFLGGYNKPLLENLEEVGWLK